MNRQSEIDKAFLRALHNPDIEIIRALIKAGANVKIYANVALSAMSGEGHADIVELLLDSGAEVDEVALTFAQENGHNEIVKMLEDKGDSK